MKDPFNQAPKTTKTEKVESGSKILDAIENGKETRDIIEILKRTEDENNITSKIWALLNESGIQRIDEETNKLSKYARYSLEQLIDLLRETREKEKAA